MIVHQIPLPQKLIHLNIPLCLNSYNTTKRIWSPKRNWLPFDSYIKAHFFPTCTNCFKLPILHFSLQWFSRPYWESLLICETHSMVYLENHHFVQYLPLKTKKKRKQFYLIPTNLLTITNKDGINSHWINVEENCSNQEAGNNNDENLNGNMVECIWC